MVTVFVQRDRTMVIEHLDRGFLVWLLSMQVEPQKFECFTFSEETKALCEPLSCDTFFLVLKSGQMNGVLTETYLVGLRTGNRTCTELSTINRISSIRNPNTGANTQMIERAWKCARLKIIKNANNVHPNSLPCYLAEIWWRSMHKTAPFNDFLAEVQKHVFNVL